MLSTSAMDVLILLKYQNALIGTKKWATEVADQIQDLVLRIYDTVADDNAWPNVLDQLVHRLGAQGCILLEWKNDGAEKRLTTPFFSEFYSADGLA